MKIKELISFLQQFNPEGEVVSVYDSSRAKLTQQDICVFNDKMEFQGDAFILSKEQEDKYYSEENMKGQNGCGILYWLLRQMKLKNNCQ